MSGLPGEMTCTECGLVARDEAVWYGGRRRIWPVAAGVLLWITAVGIASWPTGQEKGYLSMLPLRVQIEVWPTWLRTLRAVGVDTELDWKVVRTIPNRIREMESESLRDALIRRGLKELRSQPPLSEAADDAAQILQSTPYLAWPWAQKLAVVIHAEDVLFLLNHQNESAVAAGMNLAPYSSGSLDDIFDTIVAVKDTPQASEGDSLRAMFTVDRERGGVWIGGVFTEGDEQDVRAPAGWVVEYAWWGSLDIKPSLSMSRGYRQSDSEVFLLWFDQGSPVTRAALVSKMQRYITRSEPVLNAQGRVTGYRHKFKDPDWMTEFIELTRETLATDFTIVGESLANSLQHERDLSARIVSVVLRRPVSDESVSRILLILESRVSTAADAIADIQTVVDDPDRSDALRARAEALVENIKSTDPRYAAVAESN